MASSRCFPTAIGSFNSGGRAQLSALRRVSPRVTIKEFAEATPCFSYCGITLTTRRSLSSGFVRGRTAGLRGNSSCIFSRGFHGTSASRAAAGSDYYSILGAQRGESTKDIKKKFRQLAKKYHPDTNKDAGSDDKFKEVSEAWEVLKDDTERQMYDSMSHDQYLAYKEGGGPPPGGPGGINMEDILRNFGGMGGGFENMFGGGQGRGGMSRGPSMGEPILMRANLTFEEAVKGCKKDFEYPAQVRCTSCDAKGTRDGEKAEMATCGDCSGRGSRRTTVGGMMTMEVMCDGCGGTGQKLRNPCGTCHGTGLESSTKKVTVDIPAGVDSGMQLKQPGYGSSGGLGGPPGDLILQFQVARNPMFQREGVDIFSEVPISFSQSLLGGSVDVDTIDGKVEMEVSPGTKHGDNVRMKNRGIVNVNNPSRKGDQYVTFKVQMPTNLNERQRELIKEFEEEEEKKKNSMHKDAMHHT